MRPHDETLSSKAFFAIYAAALHPLMVLAFRVLGLFAKKVRAGLAMRKANAQGVAPWLEQKLDRPIWIHCASGEFEYAKPMIRSLKARYPELPLLVSYFSPTYAQQVERFPGVDFACALPWDRARTMAEFIRHHSPRALLVARTDAWPIMMREASRLNVPSLLFAATLTERSGRARGLGRWAASATLSAFDAIHCVSPDDRAQFESLGLPARIDVVGDTRYDQVVARLANPKPVDEAHFARRLKPLLVAGSTWPEDEAVLVELAARLKSEIDFVFVPHEPTDHNVARLERRLGERGITSARYSSAPGEGALVVDRVGLLAELYLKGRFAFVGGSFRKTVHSVMEPLAAGCVTFVGPLHSNNREALEFKEIALDTDGASGLSCVETGANASELERKIRSALAVSHEEASVKIRREIGSRTGATRHVIDWVESRCELPLRADPE